MKGTIFLRSNPALPVFAVMLFFAAACNNHSAPPLTAVTVEKEMIDMGQLQLNQPADAVFRITNTGQHDLLITGVTPDCHCTNVVWDSLPINPGGFTLVKTTYDSKIPGLFQKLIQVNANVQGSPLLLIIRGNVNDSAATKQ